MKSARSIGVSQRAMNRNEDLTRTVKSDAEAREQRQQRVSSEIAGFGGDIKATYCHRRRFGPQADASNAASM
jgi:hypothetical protein